MHSQQNRWPQGVAAAFSRGDMHSEQRRRERGNRAASASVLSGDTDGTRSSACEGVGGRADVGGFLMSLFKYGQGLVTKGEALVGSR